MSFFKISKIGEPKTVRNRDGQQVSTTASIHFMAPTKRGDECSNYLGALTVQRGGKVSFRITHINSSAWGKPSWRSAPYDYVRPDVEKFVLKECVEVVRQLQETLEHEG